MTTNPFGRVDPDNNVFVIEAGSERRVGQYPAVSPDEALNYYVKKFVDLEATVKLLEQRVAAKVDVHPLKQSLLKLKSELIEPAAVGDLESLRNRVAVVETKITELDTAKHEQTKEQIATSIAARLEIAERAEAITSQDFSKINWKGTSAEFAELFNRWQLVQKDGAKVPKSEADPLWKRFSTARTKFESAKRQFFAAQDSASKLVKATKTKLVESAEALVGKPDSVVEYRKLFDQWKTSGKSNAKGDDELWARFKAAGDAIYAAKAATVAVQSSEQAANLTAKELLLAEAEKNINPEKDLAAAKKALLELQTKWEKIGRVPKESIRPIEDKLKALENRVRKVDEDHWRKTDPAAQDRTNSVLSQLLDSISKLEADLDRAKATKDAKSIKDATEALEARKAWLEVVRANA